MNKFILILSLSFSAFSFSQENCLLVKNTLNNINMVDSEDLRCLSKESKNENTIVYTFGIWCSPCRLHLKNVIALKNKYDVNILILLIESETDEAIIQKSIDFIRNIDQKSKVVLLKDLYGKNKGKKYKKFLKEITPKDFENLNGMSKYLVFDKKGEIIMITTWKDNKKYDWKDDSNMIKDKIIPLLNKR